MPLLNLSIIFSTLNLYILYLWKNDYPTQFVASANWISISSTTLSKALIKTLESCGLWAEHCGTPQNSLTKNHWWAFLIVSRLPYGFTPSLINLLIMLQLQHSCNVVQESRCIIPTGFIQFTKEVIQSKHKLRLVWCDWTTLLSVQQSWTSSQNVLTKNNLSSFSTYNPSHSKYWSSQKYIPQFQKPKMTSLP